MIIYSVTLLWRKWMTNLQDGSNHSGERRTSKKSVHVNTTDTEAFTMDGDIEADHSLPPMLRYSLVLRPESSCISNSFCVSIP
ncbi:hypothetical protein R1flu_012274 [Riccia fluitans]|uniref:Uncharacterized protein n=1 Tax=Riccia fluitans TaxID=41844 RepID=A0ABD1ZE98_9MARC